MAKFEISHPRLPQLNGYSLEGPDGKQPTEEDLWFVAKQIVRPYGISQLTDEEKVSAWKNGFFEENQNMQGRESKVLEGLGELVKDAGVRFLQGVNLATGGNISPALKNISPLVAFDPFGVTGGPVGKLIKLPDQAIDYKKTENAEQFKEAGKLLYGLLDNTEELSDLPDMVAEALKQSGMPFYANNKGARGRVKAAALDYAEKATVSGLAEGGVRGFSTSQFLGRGANYLANALEVGAKDMVGMLDDSDILDLVNSEIKYDQSMQQYEDAADMGAMILENPGIAAKSVTASLGEALTLGQIDDRDIFEVMGGDVNDITQESELLQDLRSGFVQPDQGISFMTEILADPLNAGTGVVAKGLTFPQRVALSGTIKKTLSEVAVLNKKLAPLLKGLEKMPADALVRNRVAQAAKPLMDELAQKQAIINKFGRNSLTARFAAQASPAELLKQASKIADNTAAGKMTMDMVYSAMKPTGKMSLARKSAMQAMKLNPEIAGATLGFALGGGVPGMVAGAMLPSMLKGARFLSILPQEVALRFIMRSAADAGQEITEAQAMKQWRMTTNAALYGTGILGLGSLTFGESGNASSLLGGALAVKTLPKLAKFADGFIRDARVVGSEMIFAQTTKEAGPFFNRLAMLPGAEEGLIGANKDRLQMLNAPSGNFFTKPIEPFFTGAKTASNRVGKMTSEFRAGGVGKQPVISETTRNLARFLDNNPMLGRSIEAVGRAGENLAVASALPAALGFVGAKGDVEGAVAGAAISLPFTMAGVGVGQYQKFKNKGELFEQAIGDLHYYREHLTKDEQVAFDELPMGHRMGISKYSISHPDVVIRPGKEGQGNWHFDEAIGQSIIEYNPSTGEGLFDGLLAHEVGHHIEIHGLTPMINKIYFGDPVTGEGGVYGKYDADGNIVTNEEFNTIRDYYNRALIGDESISDSDRTLNQQDLGRTTSEIFAEQVKDYLLSGKKEKGRTAVEKIIRSASDAMMGASFVRDFLMKIGRPLDGNGRFVEEGFFQGMKSIGKGVKIKRIPEITKLIDKYYSDTRGLRKREIQGDQKTAPGEVPIDRSIRKEGKRPIEQDFDTAFTTEDQNNPAIQAVLNTGGLFKWRANENGEAEVQKGPTGAPLRYTAGELKKEQAKQADHAKKVFEDAGIEIIYTKDGRPYTNEITNLSPEVIDKLAQGPWHPRQIQTLREISRSLQEGDGERAGFLIGYFAATTGRKPKPVPFKYRHEMPYAFRMTKDGNLLVMLHDVDQLQRNLQFLKSWKNLPSEYQQLFDSDNEVWQAFNLYRNNTAKGLKGELDLDPNENRAMLKKNFLNALHGGITQQQVALNPLLEKIGYKIASRNTRRGFGAATKSFRIDRVFDVKRSGMQSSPASVDRLKSLYMPRESKGRNKKVLLRTTDEIAESIKAEAEARGISANDVYNERIARQLPPQQEPKIQQKESDITLTPEESALLKKTTITAEDADAYRKAVEKRKKLAEKSILGDKLFMPSVNERKALKYGKKLNQAQRLDKSIISDARKEWKQLGYEAPNFQRFMKLEDEFGDFPPALATLEPNGNFKPTELYYVGDIGVAKNANYDKTLNIQKRLLDKVDNRESHRWNADETITVTTDRKKARELQAKLDPDHVPLVLASNAKYIFDASNPEHIASLKLPEGEIFPANPEAFFAFEPEIKARGWHGYKVGDEISIFDSTRLKLIKDQSAETKLISKDRPFGKVSGLFGQKLPSDSFNSSTKKDIRFMPLTEAIDARSEWLSKTFSSKNFQDFITRKGKPNFALKNKNGDYLPVPWYHGGTIGEGNKGKLKDWTFKDNLIWLSADREFAREFSMYRGADPFLYEAPMRSASDVGDPIMVATNASNVFHYGNPEHIKMLREKSTLDYYEIEDLRLGEWYDVEPHLKLLQDLGFDGTRIKQDGTENVVIFDRKDIKLIRDVNDPRRSVEVSGKFIGDQLFLPQLKFDFNGKGSAVEMSPVSKDRAPTFWKLFKINPKDPKVYDKVADVLIDTGTPSNDPANALDHGKKLGIDPKKLRQAMARAQRRYHNKVGRLYMPAAYHGTPHTFSAEPNAPLGRFRSDKIGTGEGNQAYGHGLYFASSKEVGLWYKEQLENKTIEKPKGEYLKEILEEQDRVNLEYDKLQKIVDEAYESGTLSDRMEEPEFQKLLAKREKLGDRKYEIFDILDGSEVGTGSLYKVELAPKENEYLYLNKLIGDQPKGVQEKLKKFLREQESDVDSEGSDTWWFVKRQDWREIANNTLGHMTEAEISKGLKEAGIPGIKYLDGSSRSKGEGDYNYVIFDEADVQITDKLFMPASEAGAGKGKQAEAAKLWQEKGTDSPYFKKWFGKSKVVDENGEPLVVYHGTDRDIKSFDIDAGMKTEEGHGSAALGTFFTADPQIANVYTGQMKKSKGIGGNIMPVYLKIQNPYLMPIQEMMGLSSVDAGKAKRVELIKKGFDGIIQKEPSGKNTKVQIVAFKPEQIKSATGNRGTFDAGERNILFMPSKGDTTPASVQSWDDANPTFGANFTKGMAKDNKEAAALLRKSYEDEFGEPIKAQDFTQDQVEWLGDMLAQEGEAALGRTGNAVNWYTSAVEKALSVAEEIFPEIGQKFEAKDRFLGALSITSQNMRVMDNAKGAVKQYQHKERTGKFDYSIKHGAKADAITSNLKLYDKVEAKMGVDKLNDFLDADFTVKELIEWGRDFFGDKKFSIAGYSTDKVKGSAIFGPKIGQGFFQNLRGNYDPVTVDLWLRRTYGRLTGLSLDTALSPGDIGRIIYAVRNNKGKRKFAGLEMPEFLRGVSISGKLQKNGVANFKISDKAFEALFGDNTIGRDNYEAIYEFAEKLNREWERSFAKANTDVKKAKDAIKKAKKEKRGTTNLEKQLTKFEAEKVAIGKEKPQWAKAGSTVNDKLKPIDVPSNAERAVITKAFNVALKSLKDKGINLTPADLQATLWYPEKDIWAYLKGENSDSLNMSYDTAMEVIRDQR